MTNLQIPENTTSLEQRVATLETELAKVKQILATSTPSQSPWWLKVVGSMETDPTFDEVVKLGEEWRKSVE